MLNHVVSCTHSDEFIEFAKFENEAPLDLTQLNMSRSEDVTIAICLNHAKELVELERAIGMPFIHVGIIDDDGVNGFAKIWKGEGFIAINSGAIRVIFDAAFRLLAHHEIFPHIGDPAAEKGRAAWHSGLFDNYKNVIARRGSKLQLHDMYPKDEVRGAYAMQLGIQAFRYLVVHEIAHIRRGHAGYFETRHGVHRVNEVGPMDKKVNAIDVQATEVDADRYAFGQTFLMLSTRDGALDLSENTVRGWLYSVYLFFWLFADEDSLKSGHPLPMLRVVGASAVVRGIIRSKLGDAAVATFNQYEVNSIREFNEALRIMVNPTDRLMKSLEMQIKMYQTRELHKMMQAARQRWDELRADIQKFSFVPLT